jgi:hypothetical protein
MGNLVPTRTNGLENEHPNSKTPSRDQEHKKVRLAKVRVDLAGGIHG